MALFLGRQGPMNPHPEQGNKGEGGENPNLKLEESPGTYLRHECSGERRTECWLVSRKDIRT